MSETATVTTAIRERWLQALVDELRPYFADAKLEIPPVVRVSVGWPSKGGASGKTNGECWDPKASEDGCSHIFVAPTLKEDEVGHVLVHELLHAVMWSKFPEKKIGHGKVFAEAALTLGLEGPAKATVAGELLAEHLAKLRAKIGAYPHSAIHPILKEKKARQGWALVCACVPRRVLKGDKDTVNGPSVTCAGCSQVMRVERVGPEGDAEPKKPDEDPDQGHPFPDGTTVTATLTPDQAMDEIAKRFGQVGE